MFVESNLLSVVLAAAAGFVIGFVWYMPQAFGTMWMKLSGVSQKDMNNAKKKGYLKQMAACFLSLLVMAWVLSQVLMIWGSSDMVSAMKVAATMWLGFVATVSLSSVLWEKKPIQLWALNNAHSLVVLCAMAAVLTYM